VAETRGRILVADDNADTLAMLRLLLSAEGYSVRIARDGEEALRLQRAEPADIVITDLFMPERDGFELMQALKQDFPGTRLVVMSGDARKVRGEYLSNAAMMGADATVKKPVDAETLLRTLQALQRPATTGSADAA